MEEIGNPEAAERQTMFEPQSRSPFPLTFLQSVHENLMANKED